MTRAAQKDHIISIPNSHDEDHNDDDDDKTSAEGLLLQKFHDILSS